MSIGVVEVADDDEGNSRCESNALRYFLLALFAPFFVDVVPEHLSLDHIQRQPWDQHIGEHPADAGGEDKHSEVKPI